MTIPNRLNSHRDHHYCDRDHTEWSGYGSAGR
jgi:hypothetical protein